jgi:Protein of unknown function (DUF2948)
MMRLLAQDGADLGVVAALLQDAIILRQDMAWDRQRHLFVILLQRYRWEQDKTRTRVRSALKIDHVIEARSRGELGEPMALLSIEAEKATADPDDPAVDVRLSFSGGATIRLAADSLSITLEDLTSAWPTSRTPHHNGLD